MNQLVEINLIFHWFYHCLNTFTYQIVKINQISSEMIIKYTKSCTDFRKNVQYFIKILVKESNFNVSEQPILILKHSELLEGCIFI